MALSACHTSLVGVPSSFIENTNSTIPKAVPQRLPLSRDRRRRVAPVAWSVRSGRGSGDGARQPTRHRDHHGSRVALAVGVRAIHRGGDSSNLVASDKNSKDKDAKVRANAEVRVCTGKACRKDGSLQTLTFFRGMAPPEVDVETCGCLGG